MVCHDPSKQKWTRASDGGRDYPCPGPVASVRREQVTGMSHSTTHTPHPYFFPPVVELKELQGTTALWLMFPSLHSSVDSVESVDVAD